MNVNGTIIYVVDSLGVGGAEQVIRQSIGDIKECTLIIVVLNTPIIRENLSTHVKVFNVNHRSQKNFLRTCNRLRKIFQTYKPVLIHAHLYWSTIFSRIAKPKHTPLVVTYHSLLYQRDSFQYSWKMIFIDKLTSSMSSFHIYVSEQVKQMYEDQITKKVSGKVVPNFFDPIYNTIKWKPPGKTSLNLVAVGNFRPEKDYSTLLEAFKTLPKKFNLTIIGHHFDQSIIKGIDRVKLVESSKVKQYLNEADIFISSSIHEGFGISVIEAMSAGLPCVLSDINTYKEITKDSGFFFIAGNPKSLAQKISELSEDFELMKRLSIKSLKCSETYTKKKYLIALKEIYYNVVLND